MTKSKGCGSDLRRRSRWGFAWTFVVGIVVMFVGVSTLSAQEAEKETSRTKKAQVTKRGPQRVIEMETMEVVGKGQKPRVYYLISRGELTYEGLPMERSMSNEIEESVKRPPF